MLKQVQSSWPVPERQFGQVRIRTSTKLQPPSPSYFGQLRFLTHLSWQDLGEPGQRRQVSLHLGAEENMWRKHKETKPFDIPNCALRIWKKKKKSGWWLLRKLHFAQMEQSTDAEVEMQLFNSAGLVTAASHVCFAGEPEECCSS